MRENLFDRPHEWANKKHSRAFFMSSTQHICNFDLHIQWAAQMDLVLTEIISYS